jgi:hypothetical protein
MYFVLQTGAVAGVERDNYTQKARLIRTKNERQVEDFPRFLKYPERTGQYKYSSSQVCLTSKSCVANEVLLT